MTYHSSEPHPSRPRGTHHHEHHWITLHPSIVAVLLAILISGLVLALFSIVHIYLSIGVWPLFG